ncbi:hypothetical protein SFJ1713_1986 [Shigella flexneri SFJ17B]|nr:hypothetical protein SFJ1713_1986 [Shigella flexneri SFJ17B]
MSINIDGRDCCQTGQFSQDVADGALTNEARLERDILKKATAYFAQESLKNTR